MLSAICHFVGIDSMYPQLEAQLSMCLDIAYHESGRDALMKTATVKVRWYNTKHRSGMGMLLG